MATTIRPAHDGNGLNGAVPNGIHSHRKVASPPRWKLVESGRRIRWSLVHALLKYWSWQIATKAVLGMIYLAVIAEGFRLLMPPLGQRLYKLPGLGWTRDYEATYRLDLANFFSIFMLIAVWYLWGMILCFWLEVDPFSDKPTTNTDRHKAVVVVLGVVVLVADACLFYAAMTQMGWTGATFSFTAVVATAAYLAVIVFVTYVGINLRKNIADIEREI